MPKRKRGKGETRVRDALTYLKIVGTPSFWIKLGDDDDHGGGGGGGGGGEGRTGPPRIGGNTVFSSSPGARAGAPARPTHEPPECCFITDHRAIADEASTTKKRKEENKKENKSTFYPISLSDTRTHVFMFGSTPGIVRFRRREGRGAGGRGWKREEGRKREI